MKQLARIRGVWSLWELLLTLGFALCVYGWTWDKERLVQEILGGIPYVEGDGIPLLPLGKWLFLFGFFFFVVCRGMLANARVSTFERYRYGSFRSWWRMRFLTLHCKNALSFLTAYLLWGLLGGLKLQAGVALVFYLHLSAMVSVLIVADYFWRSGMAPGFLIVAEGVAYVLSIRHRLPWLAFGMYSQSVFGRSDGFPVWVLAAEAVFTGLCCMIVPIVRRKEILER